MGLLASAPDSHQRYNQLSLWQKRPPAPGQWSPSKKRLHLDCLLKWRTGRPTPVEDDDDGDDEWKGAHLYAVDAKVGGRGERRVAESGALLRPALVQVLVEPEPELAGAGPDHQAGGAALDEQLVGRRPRVHLPCNLSDKRELGWRVIIPRGLPIGMRTANILRYLEGSSLHDTLTHKLGHF